ncbi:MAG TPA: hypothetical protein VK158_02990, partial [Acidobacteriota bacterium]|nr:hypothetical protein [Acidobacteriota bacterium]
MMIILLLFLSLSPMIGAETISESLQEGIYVGSDLDSTGLYRLLDDGLNVSVTLGAHNITSDAQVLSANATWTPIVRQLVTITNNLSQPQSGIVVLDSYLPSTVKYADLNTSMFAQSVVDSLSIYRKSASVSVDNISVESDLDLSNQSRQLSNQSVNSSVSEFNVTEESNQSTQNETMLGQPVSTTHFADQLVFDSSSLVSTDRSVYVALAADESISFIIEYQLMPVKITSEVSSDEGWTLTSHVVPAGAQFDNFPFIVELNRTALRTYQLDLAVDSGVLSNGTDANQTMSIIYMPQPQMLTPLSFAVQPLANNVTITIFAPTATANPFTVAYVQEEVLEPTVLNETNETVLAVNETLNISQMPFFVAQIPNITIDSVEGTTLDISTYIQNTTSSVYTLSYSLPDDIVVTMSDNLLRFVANPGFVGEQQMQLYAYDDENVYESNEFTIIVLARNETILEEQLVDIDIQEAARVGEPVVWRKLVKRDSRVNYTEPLLIKLPESAMAVDVYEANGVDRAFDTLSIVSDAVYDVDKIELDVAASDVPIEVNVYRGRKITDTQTILHSALVKSEKTGNEINVEEKVDSLYNALENIGSKPVLQNQTNATEETKEPSSTEIFTTQDIQDNLTRAILVDADEVEVVYQTPAPTLTERKFTQNRKQVVVSSSVHYSDVLANTTLPREVQSKELVRFTWLNNQSASIDYDLLDVNGNGLYDTIVWTAPHLSEQTFEIIVITAALHLDADRSFIEDIFPSVRYEDDAWVTIPDSHFVRVVFEKNLTSDKDITIVARAQNP